MAPGPTRAAAQGSQILSALAMIAPSPFRSHKKGWKWSTSQAIQPAQVILTSETNVVLCHVHPFGADYILSFAGRTRNPQITPARQSLPIKNGTNLPPYSRRQRIPRPQPQCLSFLLLLTAYMPFLVLKNHHTQPTQL